MVHTATGLDHPAAKAARPALVLGALGVFLGDIGPSPLYTLRQCLNQIGHGAIVEREPLLGVLSLITWALVSVVTAKYVLVVMRADNRGEGGILALTALALRSARSTGWGHRLIIVAGMV